MEITGRVLGFPGGNNINVNKEIYNGGVFNPRSKCKLLDEVKFNLENGKWVDGKTFTVTKQSTEEDLKLFKKEQEDEFEDVVFRMIEVAEKRMYSHGFVSGKIVSDRPLYSPTDVVSVGLFLASHILRLEGK